MVLKPKNGIRSSLLTWILTVPRLEPPFQRPLKSTIPQSRDYRSPLANPSMNAKRQVLFAALLATTTSVPTHAGCFDWLFGKPAAPVYPYAAGFAPQATVTPVGPPVLTGTTVAPYTANYAPYATPYSANYANTLPAIAAQAPAYGAAVPAYGVAIPNSVGTTAYSLPYDNPSVLTGRPVMQTSAMQPIASYGATQTLPPAAYGPAPQAPGSGSFFSRMFGNDYQTSYYNVPTTTYRPVTQVDPATGQLITVQQPCTSTTQQVQRSPYTSLQPAAPVATPYYGEPVCGGEPPRYAPPSYAPQTYAPQTYAPQAYAPQTYAPQPSAAPVSGYGVPSGVSQATATTPSFGAPVYASPIPSSSAFNAPTGQGAYNALPAYPAPVTQAAPNTQPLSGYPEGYPYNYGNTGAATGDSAPVNQPQLDAMRPAWTSPAVPSTLPSTSYPTTSTPSSGGTLQAPPLLPPSATPWPSTNASPSGSSWPSANSLPSAREAGAGTSGNVTTAKPLPAMDATKDKYSDIAPIPAPDDYRAPAWTELYNARSNAKAVDSGNRAGNSGTGGTWQETTPATRTPSNATLGEPRTASDDRSRADGSMQYASSSALPALPAAPSAPAPRDDSGWFPIQQP